MASQVIEERILLRKNKDLLHLVAEKSDVPCCHRVPYGCHGGHVVQKVALGLVHRSEIRDDLAGLHDHLAQKQGAGTDYLAHDPHHADQGMDLLQVSAVCPQLFPDVRNGIKSDYVHAVVAEVQHVVRHVVEHNRVGVVQVPLVGIECGHDHFLRLVAPCEIARCSHREDLRDRLLELVRYVPVVVEEIPVLILLLACPGTLSPLVVLAGVVHHKIKTDGDAPFVAFGGESAQVLHRAQLGLDLAEVAYRIATVASALRAFQKGHQMEVVDPAVLDVVQIGPDSVQISCECVDVHQHAYQGMPLVPFGEGFPCPVYLLELLGSLTPGSVEHS